MEPINEYDPIFITDDSMPKFRSRDFAKPHRLYIRGANNDNKFCISLK
jgi:hypothetical protein